MTKRTLERMETFYQIDSIVNKKRKITLSLDNAFEMTNKEIKTLRENRMLMSIFESIKLANNPFLRESDLSLILGMELGVANHIIELDLSNSIISNEFLVKISRYAPNIKAINLSGCLNITNEGLNSFLYNSQYLESLNIERCEQISDLGVMNAFGSKLFQFLNLNDCPNITDKSIEKLRSSSSTLKTLKLGGTKTSANCLQILLTELKLEVADFTGIVTDEHIETIVTSQDKMTHLDISFSYQVSEESLKKFELSPQLKEIYAFGIATEKSSSFDVRIVY